MARIRIDIDTLRSYANNLQTRINEYETLSERFSNLSGTISSSWKGESCQAFSNLTTTYVSRARGLTDILIQFKDYAQNTADKFDSVDAECANRIRSSF